MFKSSYLVYVLISLLSASLSSTQETYHILRLFSDGNCESTHFATRFLPSGCASSMGSFYKRDYNTTHMWTSSCTTNQCDNCTEPSLYAPIDRCSHGMMRSAGEASQLFIPSPLENNILTYYRNTNSCSPTRDQIEEVRATPDLPFCHAPRGTNTRFYFRCSPSGNLQMINCSSPQYGTCGDPATCTTIDYPDNLTSLCLNDDEFDLTITYSCNFNYFLSGSITPPASNYFVSLNSIQVPVASNSPIISQAPTNMSPQSSPSSQPVSSSPKTGSSPPSLSPAAPAASSAVSLRFCAPIAFLMLIMALIL